MHNQQSEQFFEDFLDPGKRAIATHQLAALGQEAIPILRSLFSGEAKNRWGVPYIKIGALDCGLVTVGLLGSIAKPLEPFVREHLANGHQYAATALRRFGELEEATIVVLADSLLKDLPLAGEAASAIICNHLDAHEAIIQTLQSSAFATWLFNHTKEFWAKQKNHENID